MENTLLNLIPSSYIPEVHLSQYDVGRELTFKLMDGNTEYSVPSGAVVTVKATKPSGLGFVVNAEADGSIVTLSNTETMTNESGRFSAELSISSGETLLGTSNFTFNIEKSPHPEGTTDGDAETLIPELTLLVEETRTLVERAEESAESVTELEPRVSANENAVNDLDARVDKLSTYVTPEMFGAVGDGVTDDTEAVEEAFTHNQILLINTYKITTAITTSCHSISGNGKIIASNDFLTCNENVAISGITVEMPYKVDGIGITIKKECDISNVTILNGRVGIYVNNNFARCLIKGCTFKNMWGDTARAVNNEYAGQMRFENNFIENISNDLDRDADGINVWQVESTLNAPIVEIVGNEFHNCRGRFIKASTVNVVIKDNYLHNDSDFANITLFWAIDVQKGLSAISHNRISAPAGINISLRNTIEKNIHTIIDNNISNSKETSRYAFSTTTFSGDETKAIVIFENNTINWGNALSLYVNYIANGKYVFKNNNIIGRTGGVPLAFSGTFDATCRCIILDNTCDYLYFVRFANEPNVYGDEKVYCSKDISANAVINHTRYIGNANTLTTHGDALVEVKGSASAMGFMIFCTNVWGFYVFDNTGAQKN